MEFSMTIVIIIATVLVSIRAFSNEELFAKLKFNAYMVIHRNEWHRLITHGFVHSDWWHLFVNMFVLYFFGRAAEYHLHTIVPYPKLLFLVLYFSSMIFASSIGLIKHRDNHWYNAVGASGAVAAMLFFSIFFEPWMELRLYMAIPIPGIVFAGLYILYSQYAARRGGDHVAHDAHLLGAVFGFFFPLFIELSLYKHFISELLSR